jgi:hypothetical protein
MDDCCQRVGKARRTWCSLVGILGLGIACSGLATGCVPQGVTAAVQAYATAVSQVAQSGQADVGVCETATDATMRQTFCEKAKKNFQAVSDSAAQLQNVK